METASSNLQVCVPVACGVVGLGGDGKTVEAVLALLYVFGVELALGGVHFQSCGMAFREGRIFIGHNCSYVEGV